MEMVLGFLVMKPTEPSLGLDPAANAQNRASIPQYRSLEPRNYSHNNASPRTANRKGRWVEIDAMRQCMMTEVHCFDYEVRVHLRRNDAMKTNRIGARDARYAVANLRGLETDVPNSIETRLVVPIMNDYGGQQMECGGW